MGALADVFAAVRFTLDGTGFEAQATALANKQGKSVGGLMSQNISASIKKAALGSAGALAGLSFATAINGATKLNELAGDYQVQTGANAQEAKLFSGVLNDLFMNAHQSYDEIAQTLIGLKTHFDISGAGAKTLAADILDFAEIAGGTGADAVERLNSLVKTGVIDQSQMAATLDKVTLAHQKWGININETLDSLVKFAPAMNALGMSTNDAIAWMSIFNKAGVDAQRVTMGFNTAIQKVKTPAEFKKLVAEIAATPNDFDRAKLATDLFGKKAGAALANQLRPGAESVAQMSALIGTDYTGAVAKAATVNDNTFGGRALLLLHKFQGTLTEIGVNMGDLLTVFALVGPGLTKAVLGGLGGLGALLIPKIAEQLGLTLPTFFGKGAAAGAAEVAGEASAVAAGGPAVAAATLAQGPEVAAAAGAVGTSAGGSLVGGLAAGLAGAAALGLLLGAGQAAADAFRTGWHNAGGADFSTTGNLGDDFHRKLAEQRAAADAAAQAEIGTWRTANGIIATQAHAAAVERGMQAVEDAQTASDAAARAAWTAQAAVEYQMAKNSAQGHGVAGKNAAEAFSQHFAARMAQVDWQANLNAAGMRAASVRIGEDAAIAASQGIEQGKASIAAAWKDALTAQTAAADAADQIIINRAEITAQKKILIDKKSTAADRAQARITLRDLMAQNAELIVQQAGTGTRMQQIAKTKSLLTSRELLKGLKAKDPDVKAHWLEVKTKAEDQLNALETSAGIKGQDIGAALGHGIVTGATAVLGSLTIAIGGKWGNKQRPKGEAYGGPVAAGMPYLVGDRPDRMPELFVPDVNGRVEPIVFSRSPAPASSVTVNVPVSVQGLVKARNPMEIALQARRFARLGILTAVPALTAETA